VSRLYLLSAFSLSMIPYQGWVHLYIKQVDAEEARRIFEDAVVKGKEVVSAVGHESSAQLMSELLGREVPARRVQVALEDGDEAIVLQIAQRLPEGKVLTYKELQQLSREGKIKLYHIQLSTKFW